MPEPTNVADLDLRQVVVTADAMPIELYEFMQNSASSALRMMPRTDDDAIELVHDTFVRVGPDAIVRAAHGARTDIQFRGWIKKAIHRTLQQHRRDTTGGRVLSSLAEAMRQAADRFIRTGSRWCLQGRNDSYEPVDAPALRAAAAAVDVAPVPQAGTGERAAPIASRDDQRALCGAVLDAAGGCLDQSHLGKIIADRLGVPFNVRHELPDPNHSAFAAHADALDELFDRDSINAILDQLDPEELELLRALTVDGLGIRGAMHALGLKKHRIEALRARLIAKMKDLAAVFGTADIDVVINHLEETFGQNVPVERLDLTHE